MTQPAPRFVPGLRASRQAALLAAGGLLGRAPTEGSRGKSRAAVRSGSECLEERSEALEVWAQSEIRAGASHPPSQFLCVQRRCRFSVTKTHVAEPTGAPLPSLGELFSEAPVCPWERPAEGGCPARGGGTGEVASLLPGTCYFGPTESLFLLGLRSNASDKAPRSRLFT